MTLTICIVLYNSDKTDLKETLDTLLSALDYGKLTQDSKLYIVDNSEVATITHNSHPIFSRITFDIIHGQGNIGFGRGHNIVLQKEIGIYHLVLNPDVQLSLTSLTSAINFLNNEIECGLLSPAASYENGQKQYLCKRYPNLLDLFLRGFAPNFLKKLFRTRLAKYEMTFETQDEVYWEPPIVSGCFMFFRGDIFKKLNGFDDKYMLYFEDFDISLRTHQFARIAYVPSVAIVHKGGNAARKGKWHIKQFLRSAGIFFRSHGLKIF
ncbi:glycosyltransferase family 2 protein [Brucella anthropi]